jgi:hypothetical protein
MESSQYLRATATNQKAPLIQLHCSSQKMHLIYNAQESFAFIKPTDLKISVPSSNYDSEFNLLGRGANFQLQNHQHFTQQLLQNV